MKDYLRGMKIRKTLLQITFGIISAGCSGLVHAYDGPLIDGHSHWGADFDATVVIARYDKNKVVAQVVMPRYLGVVGDRPTTDEQVLAIAVQFPGKMFVLAGMQRPDFTFMDWNAPSDRARSILQEIDQKLSEKKVVGIGEVLVRHWAYAGDTGKIGQHAEIDKSFDNRFIRDIATVAIRHDVPVVIHMEGYPHLVKELGTVLHELPQFKLVWAHGCGRSNATIIRDLLKQHKNLICDLSNMTNTGGYGSGWPKAEAFTTRMEVNGKFLDDYRQLILDYPDRFFIGMDVAHQSRWTMPQGNTFERRVERTRALLSQLPIDVAQKLAFSNVIAIYRLPIRDLR
jgi:Tat protein secretion system quality control protein TatD with DNase activity